MIPGIAQVGVEGEIVVGPAETLAEAYVNAEHLQILVGVVRVLVRVVVIVVITVAVSITIAVTVSVAIAVIEAVHIAASVIRRVHAGLAAVVGRYRELVGSFAAEPRVKERHRVCLIVAGVGLGGYGELLSLALGDEALV